MPCLLDPNHVAPALTFDPNTKLFSPSPFQTPAAAGIATSNPQISVYDPVTDALYETSECTSGMCMSKLNLSTNTWTSIPIPCADNNIGGAQGPCGAGRTYVNSGFSKINNLYQGIDVVGRFIYFMKQGDNTPQNPQRLLRYNIDIGTVSVMAELPNIGLPTNNMGTNVAFDSVNRLVYWWTNWENANSVLYIYHPDPKGTGNGTWERDPMFQPQGIQPRGFTTAFDPIHNAFMLMGGVNWGQEPNPSFLSYYFLYRYGNGDGKPYTPPQAQASAQLTPKPSTSTPPPSAPPSTLTAKYLGVTGEDKVGPVNQTTPNGKPDFHISVSGLRGTPNKVTITNDNNGTWETPFNGTNWIIATQYDRKGNGVFWFEQYPSNKFHVKVHYADGTTDEADTSNTASTPP
jgi:hypothetical protein